MKKWCRTFLLSCLLCLSLCTLAQATDGETLRVGLKYGSDAMSAANLQNYSAFGGYALGYFDADGSFEELGALPRLYEKITVTTDTTYHVQLSGTFYDYNDASRTAAQYSGGFAAYEDGAFYARAGSYTSLSAARSAAAQYGGTAVGGSSTGVTVIVTGTDTILFEFDCGGSENLGILPIETREKTVTWFRGYRYYGGFEYQRVSGGNINVINVVDLEDYVKCVIPWEMSKDWPVEALKAQAVAARTYTLHKMAQGAIARHPDADACDDITCCKAYETAEDAAAGWGAGALYYEEKLARAVAETDGEVIVYNGEPVLAVFFSSAAGHTQGAGEVWQTDLPYLQSVDSPEDDSLVPNYYSVVTFTTQEFRDRFLAVYPAAKLNGDAGSFLTDITRNDAGFVSTLRVGGVTVRGNELRTILGLRSPSFTVEVSGDTLTFHVTGYGHGVGMSQYGANAMAKEGHTCEEILEHYFTGAQVVQWAG